jgi:hypothetical protein
MFQPACAFYYYLAVSGQAEIYLQKDEYYLALENFATSNAPDLKVYY